MQIFISHSSPAHTGAYTPVMGAGAATMPRAMCPNVSACLHSEDLELCATVGAMKQQCVVNAADGGEC